MKPPILLKTILDILFFILILSVSAPMIIFLALIFTEKPMPVEINNILVEDFNFTTISLISVSYLLAILSVYIIYLLRKLVRSFFKLKFYTRLQISLFNLIGQLIILAAISKVIINFFSSLILESKIRTNFKVDTSFDNLFFVLAMGLFFIYMSKLFENARKIKEENELTI